jgi:hypothetical protein
MAKEVARLGATALACAALLVAGTVPAAAQRGPMLACAVADHSIALDLMLPLASDGSGAGTKAGLSGSLEIHHYKVARERRRWSLDGRQPTQLWNHGNDLKLRLMLAPGENLVDLVIETRRRPDAGAHMGGFRLETGEGVRVEGRIECTVG